MFLQVGACVSLWRGACLRKYKHTYMSIYIEFIVYRYDMCILINILYICEYFYNIFVHIFGLQSHKSTNNAQPNHSQTITKQLPIRSIGKFDNFGDSAIGKCQIQCIWHCVFAGRLVRLVVAWCTFKEI